MKLALVTTTINIPHVLKLYRALEPDVKFFVVCDKKTPVEANLFCGDVKPAWAIFPESQQDWKCSEPISWNCIQRRSIGFLEALKWGAEVIVTIDDDNIPMGPYFDSVEYILSAPFNGLKATGCSHWFDVGQLLVPPAKHRGIPYDKPTLYRIDPVADVQVGVAAGICLGNPDVDALTRLYGQPDIHGVSELLRSGIVVDPATFTVFNSQNTSFIRELTPAMLMIPHVGRYDDIFASLICHRVMRERNLHVHFGQPFIWQTRNPHSIMHDLGTEQLGMAHVEEFARFVDRIPMSSDPMIPFLRRMYEDLLTLSWWPPAASAAGLAWLEDCERVLG